MEGKFHGEVARAVAHHEALLGSPAWNFFARAEWINFRELPGDEPMSKRPPTLFPDPEGDAEAIEALEMAQNLPPGKEQTEALKQAGRLRNAADAYKHIFSVELKPPE
jgi:hypothetical protein